MSASSGYPRLFPPSTVFPVSTLQAHPLRPPRTWRDLAEAVYRQWPLVLGVAAASALFVAALHASQPGVYGATSRVWLPQDPLAGAAASVSASVDAPPVDAARLEAAIEAMQSRENAARVVSRLDISEAQLSPGVLDGLPAGWPGGPDVYGMRGDRARTVDRFLDSLHVVPLSAGPGAASAVGLEVRLDTTDPVLAPRALRALLEGYRPIAARQQRERAEAASRILETRLSRAREALRHADDAIVALLVPDEGGPLGLPPTAGGPGTAPGPQRPDASPTVPRLAPAMQLDVEPAAAPGRGGPVAAPSLPATTADAHHAALRLELAPPADDDDDLITPALPPRDRTDDEPRRVAPRLHEDTALGARLGQLERQRTHMREREAWLLHARDRVDGTLHLGPAEAAARIAIDPPSVGAAPESRRPAVPLLLAPLIALLLAMAAVAWRELGGNRLRSARDVRWALGVPVFGALPTLSNRAREALVGAAFTSTVDAGADTD